MDSTSPLAAADRSLGRSIIALAESPLYEKNVMNFGIAFPPLAPTRGGAEWLA
jgi:hypothetical protein